MDLVTFIERRRPVWEALGRILDETESLRLESLEFERLKELGRLYREVSADLLWARSHRAGVEVVDYLNDLVARTYARLHPSRHIRWRTIGRFFKVDYPRLVRRHRRAIALSALCFVAGGLFGAGCMAFDPAAWVYLLPDGHRYDDPADRVQREGRGESLVGPDRQAAFAAYLFTHNIEVTILIFAVGVFAGVLTALLLFMNGVLIGALAYAYHAAGQGLFFWAWILPHGGLELSAVFIAGGAGFVLGRAVLAPGRRTRLDALREEGRDAVRLILGLVPVLIAAGLTEGTLSQWHAPFVPPGVKLAYAAVTTALLWLWLTRSGRALRAPAGA